MHVAQSVRQFFRMLLLALDEDKDSPLVSLGTGEADDTPPHFSSHPKICGLSKKPEINRDKLWMEQWNMNFVYSYIFCKVLHTHSYCHNIK